MFGVRFGNVCECVVRCCVCMLMFVFVVWPDDPEL